jgi:hypothetical protein
MSKANSSKEPKRKNNADRYGFDHLFVRESDDGDLDFLFAPPGKPKPRMKADKSPVLTEALSIEDFDTSLCGAKSAETGDRFFEQGDKEALYVVVGGADGMIASIDRPASPRAVDQDNWRDLLGTIVYGFLGLWIRFKSQRNADER